MAYRYSGANRKTRQNEMNETSSFLLKRLCAQIISLAKIHEIVSINFDAGTFLYEYSLFCKSAIQINATLGSFFSAVDYFKVLTFEIGMNEKKNDSRLFAKNLAMVFFFSLNNKLTATGTYNRKKNGEKKKLFLRISVATYAGLWRFVIFCFIFFYCKLHLSRTK